MLACCLHASNGACTIPVEFAREAADAVDCTGFLKHPSATFNKFRTEIFANRYDGRPLRSLPSSPLTLPEIENYMAGGHLSDVEYSDYHPQ